VPRDRSGGFRLDDDRREIAPLGVTEKVLEIAREPEFNAAIALLRVALERVGQSLHNVGFHAIRSVRISLNGFDNRSIILLDSPSNSLTACESFSPPRLIRNFPFLILAIFAKPYPATNEMIVIVRGSRCTNGISVDAK
jgi:hypothetical protein